MNNFRIPGRAYTPEQKRAITDRLCNAWLTMPEQRIAQLLSNVFYEQDTFYIEDQTFIETIEKWIQKRQQS